MATLTEYRAQLKEVEARIDSIRGQAGDDKNLDAVAADLLPGDNDKERLDSLAKLMEQRQEAGDAVRRLEQLAQVEIGKTTLSVSAGDPEGKEYRVVTKDFGGEAGEYPTVTLKDLLDGMQDEDCRLYKAIQDANPAGRNMRLAIGGRAKTVITQPDADLRPTDAVIAPIMRYIGALDYFRTVPVNADVYPFHQVNFGAANRAAGTARGAENDQNMTSARQVERIKTIRTTQDIARETLSDGPRFMDTVQTMLMFDARQALEQQLIAGDNAGENLNGLTRLLTGGDTGAAANGSNPHEIVTGRVNTIMENTGMPPTAIFGRAASWALVFKALMSAGGAAAAIQGFGPRGVDKNVDGVPWVFTSSVGPNDVILYHPQAYVLALRDGVMIEFSTEAEFKNYSVTGLVALRAAGALERTGAAFKFTAFNQATGDYS